MCAYSISWDASTPVGSSTNANTIDTELQNLKTSIQERMNNLCENTWETDANDPKTLAVSAIAGTPDVAVVYSSGNQTITDSVSLAVLWDTETLDTGGLHSTSSNTGRFTIVTAAYYRISVNLTIVAGSAAIDIKVDLNKNGSSIRQVSVPVISIDVVTISFSEIVLAAASDHYSLSILQLSGQNMTLNGTVNDSTFQIERINGTT